jgi:peptide/nickel transport system permease protein
MRNKLTVVGILVVGIFVLAGLFAPVIAPHDPLSQNVRASLSGPSRVYFLGADMLGRDILSRLIYGARVSLLTGIFVVGTTALVGVTLGSISGYYGGRLDGIIMRITDVVLAFPGIILALAIAGVLGPGLFNVMVALAITGWPGYCRVMRGQVLSVKEKDFVEAARALGVSDLSIIFRHIIPNSLTPIVVMATLGMGGIILAAAGLSFLGLGAEPPHPEWGSMLNAGRPFLLRAPHLSMFPGITIMLVVLGFNFLGDGLRDILDPRTV